MKKVILTILLVFLFMETSNEMPIIKNIDMFEINYVEFIPAYKIIRNHEGYYSNVVQDKGKETYAGITRRYNPEWYGWRYIDLYKRKHGKLKLNQKIDNDVLEFYILDFYLDIWIKEGFDKLINQDVAEYVFDFRVNSNSSIKIIQKTISRMGYSIKITGKMNEQTIYLLNKIEPKYLISNLRNARIYHYKSLVKKDASQKHFLKHWLIRANML